jgi:hypothetical protein
MKARVLSITVTMLIAFFPTLAGAGEQYQLILVASTPTALRIMPIVIFSDKLINKVGHDGKSRCDDAAKGASVVPPSPSPTQQLSFVCVKVGDE